MDLIEVSPGQEQETLIKRVEALTKTYARMSDIYQRAKAKGRGADVLRK
jgi:hypothetical protein